jgi:4-amino-4-deoxy-L-arabinose transferase-like glycosyltransferase
MNWSPKVRDAVWVAIISAAVTLPFLDKPFHIDDTLMLLLAGNVVENPLDPYAGSVDWHGVPESHLTTETSPPLWNYYLAPFLSGWGASEVALHAAMLPFFVLLAAATLWLARRFSGAPWWVLLFVMASPGVVVSGNVMRDIPASALFAAALAATVAGTDRRDSRRLLLGGLLAGMAILTKYSAAVLIPLIALYPVLRRRPRLAAWCVVPIAIVALWNLLSQLVYGEPHLLSVMKFSDRFSDDWTLNLVRAFPVLGSLVYLSPLLLLHAFARRDWIAAAGAPVPGLAASLAQLGLQDSLDLQFVFWSLMGGVLLWVLMVAGIRAGIAWLEYAGDDEASDSLFLVAWACAPLFFSVIFPSFQAVRHLLPALPALVLLGIRYLQIDSASPPLRKAFVAPILALQTAMAFLVATADYEYAAAYREFAANAAQRWGEGVAATGFVGHWGWLFYAERAGLVKVHAAGPLPEPLERIVVPRNVNRVPIFRVRRDLRGRFSKQFEVRYRGRIPVQTMNPNGAGFYGPHPRPSRLPSLPYRLFPKAPLEVFDVYRAPASD